MSEDLRTSALERLLFVLMQRDVPNLPEIKNRFQIILDDYKVEPKETALVVYTEGKNEYYIKRFLLGKAVAGCTKQTLKQYDRELRRVFRDIGKDAEKITALDIQLYLAEKMQRLSPVSVDNTRRFLSTFYGWCQREELILKNPMSRVENIKLKKQKKPAFSEIEVEKLRGACRNMREKAVVETLLSTGCRASELVQIRICDLKGRTIDVLGKGEKRRFVYLNAKAVFAISAYLEERKDDNPFLFPKMDAGVRSDMAMFKNAGAEWYKNPELVSCMGHMDKSSLEYMMRKLGNRAGVEKTHPHRFRRTCATFALRRGMPIEQVSKMLGHEQLDTTQIYLDLTESELAYAHSKYVV